jgi:DNA-binding response OmpR family regulator
MDAPLEILIVEDHDNLREILTQHLAQHGHRSTGVADAVGLAERMARVRYDVVVLDLNLPDEDGLSIAKRLRAIYPSLFIVMMTARNSNADRVAGYDSGADVYITKPSSGEELLAAVNSWQRRSVSLPFDVSRVQFDIQARELVGIKRISLGTAETIILQCLCLAPNLRIEYYRLIELLDHEVNAKGKAMLEVHITRLRKKLLQVGFPKPAIKAIRNEGYQLVEPVVIV